MTHVPHWEYKALIYHAEAGFASDDAMPWTDADAHAPGPAKFMQPFVAPRHNRTQPAFAA